MKRLFSIVVMTLLGCTQTPATTACLTVAGFDQPAPKHWKRYRVMADVGDYLLGINGDRILAGNAAPLVRLKGTRAVLEEVWLDQVDWPVYQHTARDDEAVMSVHFDSDKMGRQHICRIEKEERADRFFAGEEDEQGKSLQSQEKLIVVDVQQFSYDTDGRLMAVERKMLGGETKGFQSLPASCFQYTAAGNVKTVAEVAGGDCRNVTPADRQTRFVYDTDDRLIRKIFSEEQFGLGESQYTSVLHPVVQVFDTSGKLIAEYRETADWTPFRKKIVPATASSHIRDTWVMEDPPRNFIYTDNWGRDWIIVAVPAGQEVSYSAMELPGLTTLAKGKTSKQGLVNLAKSAPAIRKALHQADTVVAFYSVGQVFILSPAVSAEVWQKCQNSEAVTRDACP